MTAAPAPGSTQRASCLRDGRTDVPDGFAALLFGRAAPEDLVALSTRAELAALAREAWTFFGTRKPGAPKIRFESPDASRGDRLEDHLGDRDRQRRHAVPGQLGDGRAERARARRPPRRASDPGRRARQGRQAQVRAAARPRAGNGASRESFIHIHVERVDDDARRAEIVQALEQVLAEVRAAVQDWRPMVGARRRASSRS